MNFAFVFPGQASQSLKMLDGLSEFPEIKDIFDQTQDILKIDFLAMLQENSPENINKTINTQPLMLASSIATYQIWQNNGGRTPSILAGHSLGEWSALVVSGVISLRDGLELVKLRALAMQESVATGQGAMAAVLGMDDAQVIQICAEIQTHTKGVVAGVNFNSPGQVVIAGDTNSVEQAMVALKNAGAKKVQLVNVSVPSHCKLMLPASKKLADAIDKVHFNTPKIPVIHNIDASVAHDIDSIKQSLIKQLYSPVLWSKTIAQIVNMGIVNILECGPGKVLSGLNKRIDPNIISYNLHNKEDLTKALNNLNN